MTSKGAHEIRAATTDATVRVYQAYGPQIANPAVRAQTFVAPFAMERMTWIKPSLNWMRYRAGDGTKLNQERVLAIDVSREGFDWALENAVLSHYVPALHALEEEWKRQVKDSLIRVQWDPERDIDLQPIPELRSIQIGLRGQAVADYVRSWIVAITDITPLLHPATRSRSALEKMLSREKPYAISKAAAARLVHDGERRGCT